MSPPRATPLLLATCLALAFAAACHTSRHTTLGADAGTEGEGEGATEGEGEGAAEGEGEGPAEGEGEAGKPCRQHVECQPPTVCGPEGVCERAECEHNSDCAFPLVCGPRAFCIIECLEQRDCYRDEVCAENVCVPDRDGDGVEEPRDNGPTTANADQRDRDRDGQGDLCDSDLDGDGVDNDSDNCPNDRNPQQEDGDDDGVGDACE